MVVVSLPLYAIFFSYYIISRYAFNHLQVDAYCHWSNNFCLFFFSPLLNYIIFYRVNGATEVIKIFHNSRLRNIWIFYISSGETTTTIAQCTHEPLHSNKKTGKNASKILLNGKKSEAYQIKWRQWMPLVKKTRAKYINI